MQEVHDLESDTYINKTKFFNFYSREIFLTSKQDQKLSIKKSDLIHNNINDTLLIEPMIVNTNYIKLHISNITDDEIPIVVYGTTLSNNFAMGLNGRVLTFSLSRYISGYYLN